MLVTTHLVKSFDIGLNNNLYGGRMLDWIDETGALFTRELFPKNKFVTLKIAETIFHNPVHANDVIKFFVIDPCGGKTSLSFKIKVMRNSEVVLSTDMVFVCISDSGEKQEYNPYTLNKDIFRELTFNRAKRYYNNSNSYHNIDHINDLIEQLNSIELNQEEYNILCSAICYHDSIYIPNKNDNELKSMKILKENIINNYDTEMASEIIRSTSSFNFNAENFVIKKLSDIMHDLDYSYFIDFEKLVETDEKIKNEYLKFITEEQFNKGRTEFLYNLINKDIYRSVYKKYNNISRENIVKLLNSKYKI